MKQYYEIKFQAIYQLNQTKNEQWYNIIYSTTIPQTFHQWGLCFIRGQCVWDLWRK